MTNYHFQKAFGRWPNIRRWSISKSVSSCQVSCFYHKVNDFWLHSWTNISISNLATGNIWGTKSSWVQMTELLACFDHLILGSHVGLLFSSFLEQLCSALKWLHDLSFGIKVRFLVGFCITDINLQRRVMQALLLGCRRCATLNLDTAYCIYYILIVLQK